MGLFQDLLGVGSLAPNFVLQVEGIELDENVMRLVQVVEYESADGIADVLKLRCDNPEFVLSESRVFAPGNEVSVFMGYGPELVHIGRTKIYKNRPNFPQEESPSFEVVAYTRDHEMMFKQPEASASSPRGRGRQRGGRRFQNVKFSDAVIERAEDYGFELDVDETPEEPTNFIQKVGMTDYEFVTGLANLSGFIFWVDGDERGRWTLHFRDPERLTAQERVLTFEYNQGDMSTLLSFEPELLVSGAVARIRARIKDPITGRVMEAEFNEDNENSPETLLDPTVQNVLDQTLDQEPATSTAIQLFIGDYSFDELANRRFRSEAELIAWARQWFRRQRENFILSEGVIIGVEDVMARQVHTLANLGTMYSGSYYFSRVRHVMSEDNGYTCDFSCRKQTPSSLELAERGPI